MNTLKEEILEHTNGGIGFYTRHLPDLKCQAGVHRCANVKNPFYEDAHASLSVYLHEGQWHFKDHGNDTYAGDVFAFAGFCYGLNPATQFTELLAEMAQEMGIEPPEAESSVSIVPFTAEGLAFWTAYGVSLSMLNAFDVVQVSGITVNGKFRKLAPPSFGYKTEFGHKIYSPKAAYGRFQFVGGKGKWLFGLKLLPPKADLMLITGAEKDLLAGLSNAAAIFPGLSVTGIALNSETARIDSALLADWKQRFGRVLLVFDDDKTGLAQTEKYTAEYHLDCIVWPKELAYFTDSNHNKPGKDLADWCRFFRAGMLGNDGSLLSHIVPYRAGNVPKTVPERAGTTVPNGDGTALMPFKAQEHGKFNSVLELLERKSFRRNSLTGELEIKLDGKGHSIDINSLYINLVQEGMAVSFPDLNRICASDRIPEFNPIAEYFHGLPEWGGEDHIGTLCGYLDIPDTRFRHQFGKWLVRMLRCALEPSEFNKQMLVLVSQSQDMGKSTFIRWLLPKELQDYYMENPNLRDKDSLIAAASSLLIHFDELGAIKRFSNEFKTLASSTKNSVRLPYGAAPVKLTRIASLIASTNEYDFIVDETGSVRFLCFEINGIDFTYSKEMNADMIWTQAWGMYLGGTETWEMSREELAENQTANEAFTVQPEFETIILRYFQKPGPGDCVYNSSSELKDQLIVRHPYLINYSEVTIGRTLTKIFGPSRTQGKDRIKRYPMQVTGRFNELGPAQRGQ